jgi:ubiquinone/menaquinone biosynthesis C-methylase UbiE
MNTLEGRNEETLQHAYYTATADDYNRMHVGQSNEPEHDLALGLLVGLVGQMTIDSILDVGAGTGRALLQFGHRCPGIRVVGVEPVAALRQQGYKAGISPEQLVDGDAMKLAYPDGAFDLVCEFGVLHHLKRPDIAVAEMLRVAKRAVFISDSNNFGAGSKVARTFKQGLRALRLWPLVDWLNTRGKGYHYSLGDGVFYSYSVFDNYSQINGACSSVHVMNTRGDGKSAFRSASHVALLGFKK